MTFAEVLVHFPEHLLPARRKKRPYISSILSKNEVSREDKYNRKLFLRIRHGHYIINPRLSLRVEGEWRNVYELLSLDMIGIEHQDVQGAAYRRKHYDPDFMAERYIKQFAEKIKSYTEKGVWDQPF